MDEVKKLFGKQIKHIRRVKNLTQAQLAEKTGLSINYISEIEVGIASPAFETLWKLATALGVEIKTLFDFDDKPNSTKVDRG